MWFKEYRDYPIDSPLIKEQIGPGEMSGCEMHDLNGWGNTLHTPKRKKKRSIFSSLLSYFLGKKSNG